jgi:hypothetical protein
MSYLISHSKRFIFVHVPKAAGMSVTHALGRFDDYLIRKKIWRRLVRPLTPPSLRQRVRRQFHVGHLTAQDIRAFVPDFDGLFRFAFVRNPWDLHVSLYQYVRRTPVHPQHAFYKDKTFEDYLSVQAAPAAGRQAHFLCDGSGALLVDFVGRFERLEDDFRSVCKKIGVEAELPHLNRSRRDTYRSYYTAATRELVARIDRRDIELFDYSF